MTIREWITFPNMEDNLIPRANPKEKGNINPLTIRESVEEIPEDMGREVCQRTQWDSDGTSVAITWSRSAQLRAYMRSLTLENARALLVTLKQAHSDFQHNARNASFENWHESIDENF
jgi:hypothetical protein